MVSDVAATPLVSTRPETSGSVLRLGALSTHPIQYQAPLHRALASIPGVELTVYFAHQPSPVEQGLGFGVAFSWDDDLLSGYRSVWLRNLADERRAAARRPFRDGPGDYDTPEIAEIVRSERFDAFLLHGWRVRSEWQALRACRASGIPTLVRGDSQLRGDSKAKRCVKRLVYPRLLGQFSVCLSVGARSEAYLRYYGARRIVRSPHFVDNALFAQRAAAAAAQRDARRAAWAIPRDALVLLFAGKLMPVKRPLDLLRAAQGLAGVHVLFAGDGPLRQDGMDLAQSLGVPATFAGFLNQSMMPEAYAAGDVLVLPSGRETWGLVVNEAMACGRPAIVSDAAGCTPDLILDGETGFSYPAGDVVQLRGCIERLLHPGTAERLGTRARQHVAQYTAASAAGAIVDAVREALCGAGT